MRLFVGIDPPDPIKVMLLSAMGGISGARWQRDDQLHLTLRFIGEVDRHMAADVAAALSGVHHPELTIALEGTDVFGKPGRPDTLWVGVTPEEPVKVLHNKVDQCLARVGLLPEKRQFKPHITIARLGPRIGALNGFLEESGGLTSPPFTVRDFCLYESRLTQEGANYTILERYPLGDNGWMAGSLEEDDDEQRDERHGARHDEQPR